MRYIYILTANAGELQRITALLPEELRNLVVTKEITQKILDTVDKQLERVLQIPASNAIRRSTKSIGFFPADVCIEINKPVLPANKNDFEVYESQVKALVDMVIERTKRGLYFANRGVCKQYRLEELEWRLAM